MSLIYDLKINKNTAWGGDESTQYRPVSGQRIEEWIKESINTLEESEEQRNTDTYEKILELTEFKDLLNQERIDMHDELYDRVPIYSSDLLERKPKDIDKYLIIPSIDSDLDGTVTNNTVTAINGTYLDILFKSIKALLLEVARLRNSFRYGINSYKEDNTAMSEAVHDIEDPDEEPLWAVDPEGLSFIDQISIDENHTLTGPVDSSTKGVLKIVNMSSWESLPVSEILDSKIFFYFTTSVPDISILLEDEEENVLNLNLSNIIESRSLQNILVIISRETSLGGKNFIYITADNINLDLNIVTGYYTGISNTLAVSPYYISQKFKFKQIQFRKLDLYKTNVYSKYQDFSNQVIPVKPNDSNYKFEAAHITIRSVKTYKLLKDLAKYLLDSELVYCKDTRRLYIVDEGRIQPIGGTSKPEEDDTGMTLTELIEKLLEMGIVNNESGLLSLNDVSDITFINSDTNERFKVTIDAYGLFKIDKINTNPTLSERMEGRIFEDWNIRGLVGVLKGQENNIAITKDFGLKGDRIKIGAIYAPLSTDTIFGCTHGYIELENTSDEDFVLDECYLHMCQNHPSKGNVVYHLPLTGIIPAGGTYLIRCKKYAEPEDANTFINVNSFDIEWYVEGELLDLTIYSDREMGFALTYRKEDLSYNTSLYKSDSSDELPKFGLLTKDKNTYPYAYDKYFIDSIYIGKAYINSAEVGYWGSKNAIPIKSNSIFKNTFELDPAKQAFQATTTKESSRVRWLKEEDYLQLSLNDKYIKFPNSEDIYPIDYFTPKASFEHKNVCTDKSKLDMNKPNMVTCSFGIDIYKTRCFNWISAGKFNEYVFIKDGSSWIKIASYGEEDTSGLRKTFSEEISNIIYNRIFGRFPANNTYFTSHKCIINVVENNVESPTTYTYVVGRADKNGNPDLEHCSEEYTFTLYPNSYTPRIYQITDQQGFHWIEYQVWAAAANKINERILQDLLSNNIIPILINTGDMTQNGTRINEWLDYYNAGKCLFDHLEQMNVIGNNDLCGTNPWILGTGDDIGKSNSFYFHLFYCYEINPNILPVVNNKYIPSLYYFDSNTTRYLMVNSEITYENCKNWFNLLAENNDVINIYTGYTIPMSSNTVQQYSASTFTPIYNLIYQITNTQKEIIGVCHELPFTVITRDSLKTTLKTIYRSISSANKLVGSHLNQLCPEDNGKGIYWFSRLMEFRGVKLVIGGHKHTYSCTYPLREYYEYGVDLNSEDNGPMTMEATLENDTAIFISNDLLTNYTKFPLTKRSDLGLPAGGDSFWPYKSKSDLTGGVIYFMCQATGYKLTSNKELPSPDQKFSIIVPNTGEKNQKDTADDNLKHPMFSIIDNTGIKLVRIENILNNDRGFTQISYGTLTPTFKYLLLNQEDNHGTWGTTEDYLITL